MYENNPTIIMSSSPVEFLRKRNLTQFPRFLVSPSFIRTPPRFVWKVGNFPETGVFGMTIPIRTEVHTPEIIEQLLTYIRWECLIFISSQNHRICEKRREFMIFQEIRYAIVSHPFYLTQRVDLLNNLDCKTIGVEIYILYTYRKINDLPTIFRPKYHWNYT